MEQINLEDYFRLIFEEDILKLPVQRQNINSSATRFWEKRREVDLVGASLKSKRHEFDGVCEKLRERKENLWKKEEKMKEALLKFDKFIKENDAKRSRGIRKAELQRVAVAQKEKELEDLKQEYSILLSRREKLQNRVTRATVYHLFLATVGKMSKKFEDIPHLISRFDTLLVTRDQLQEHGRGTDTKTEGERTELRRYVNEQNSVLLQLNNTLSERQTELDSVLSEACRWEYTWNHIQATAAKETLMLGQIKFATLNLYHFIGGDTGKEEGVQIEDTVDQLEKIHLFIQDLVDITGDSRF
ncbi:coiled-coil domain-containing protein 42 homolog [Clupea harengus]|uniref:Coiled-coil domain-containing protein 42 homolog n=1 Tax=Clupea harengus TaxID=7950 RepID=A0A6P3WBI5_CLUHA|nr:coiled-coil domain-containing protein 42 homolog [Clupea harengus]